MNETYWMVLTRKNGEWVMHTTHIGTVGRAKQVVKEALEWGEEAAMIAEHLHTEFKREVGV